MAVRSGVMTDDVESRDRSELQKTPMPTRHAKKAKTYTHTHTHTHTHTPYSLARLGVGPRRTRLSRVTRGALPSGRSLGSGDRCGLCAELDPKNTRMRCRLLRCRFLFVSRQGRSHQQNKTNKVINKTKPKQTKPTFYFCARPNKLSLTQNAGITLCTASRSTAGTEKKKEE